MIYKYLLPPPSTGPKFRQNFCRLLTPHNRTFSPRKILLLSARSTIAAFCPLATSRRLGGLSRGRSFLGVAPGLGLACYRPNIRALHLLRILSTARTLRAVLLHARPELQPLLQTPPASDPASTWLLLPQLGPCSHRGLAPPSQHEALVLAAFGRPTDALLTRRRHASLAAPYDYFKNRNLDPSYVSQPRLLVLKLLPLSWCELRAYFDVYAGLPLLVRTPRMALGSDYHKTLEDRAHRIVDLAQVEAAVATLVARLPQPRQAHVTRGSPMTIKLAYQWVEQILVRALVVSYTGEAREMHLHGYIDLDAGVLAAKTEALGRAVLVNGVADVVRLDPVPLEEALSWDPTEVRQLSPELCGAKLRMDAFALHHTLEVRDIKTRQYNNVPKQELVVTAARDQCMYYLQFLTTLAQSPEYGYASLMENLARRGVDVRSSLAEASAVALLVTHFGVLVNDYLALARGNAIGFALFDTSRGALPSAPHLQVEVAEKDAPVYSLANVLSETEFQALLADFHGTQYADIDVSVLFGPWETALTPAYFCARAAQALHLFERFEPSSVCVEYHNVRTKRIIECKQFAFDKDTLASRTQQAAGFWLGTRDPEGTTDRGRCKSCNYRSRCPSVNKPQANKSTVGEALAEFLADG